MLLKDTYYKNSNNEVYYYSAGTFLKYIKEGLIEISKEEADSLLFSFEYYKQNKLNEIDYKKDEEITKDVEYKGFKFQNRDSDRNLLTSTVVLYSAIGEVPKGFVWISSDNKQIPMRLNELVELGAIMGSRVNEITLKARFFKDAVLAAKSKEEIDQIEWIE
ncbi:DUF4376 domain-containing protein [Campylobacter devanensis]|uniref:DUF4376 domain-containing protein n=1 Tax=Campylobacter devanensis TaxID=3161138 RepID=UPI000A33FAFB|nr:DUF4376 domain-containing protein [Campylobacter sp. P0227]